MLLGIDLGTTNIKALLVEEDGTVRAQQGAVPVDVKHGPDGGVEQDIEQIWRATCQAIAQAGAGGALRNVRAVGISSQGGAIQLRTRDGRCVGPVISWLDGRGHPFDRAMTEQKGAEWFAARIGHGGSGVAIGQALRLRKASPSLLSDEHGIGFVGDTIVQRLCGRAAHDHSSLSIANLYNPALRRADPDVLAAIELDEGRLPDLLAATEQAGTITPDAARQIGLPEGIPVTPAVHDQYAAAVGCGALENGDVMFGAGTAWVLLAVADRMASPIAPLAWVCDHVVEGRWGHLLSLVVGGSVFRWALAMTGLADAPADKTDELMERIPPGCEGLSVFPFHDGRGGPHRLSAGQMRGLRLAHGPGHLLRGCVEGLSFELARQLGWLADAGCGGRRLVMCGRTSGTRCTPRIVADVTGQPVNVPAHTEVSAFGAAVLARRLIEPGTQLEALAREMVKTARTFEPSAARTRYEELLGRYATALDTGVRKA